MRSIMTPLARPCSPAARAGPPGGRPAISSCVVRILYGVVGEGMGHAMRSRVILDELTKQHEVQVVVSGRAYDYLQKRVSENLAVRKIWGYTLVYEDNEVDAWKTAARNLKGALTGCPASIK